MKALILILSVALCATSSARADNASPGQADVLLQDRIRAHITFLADDLLRGRRAGTPGYDIAAAYVSSQFRQLGLAPAGVGGGWFQPVPLQQALLVQGSAHCDFLRNGQQSALQFLRDFFMRPNAAYTTSDLTASMVFAGYGIRAPQLHYDDYQGLDVRGKVVVILGGQPLDFPSEIGAHYASGSERTQAAVAAGAVGVITVFTPRNEQRYAWSRLDARVGQPSMRWLDERGQPNDAPRQIQASVIINYQAAGVLFEGSGHSLQSLLDLDEAGKPLPAFPLSGRVHLSQQSTHQTLSSNNVIAALPGSDPLLRGQYVVYSAHLDHLGVTHTGEADTINNGALDNASGVAVMLETARLFTEGKPARRSLLFVAVTAEEMGLLGSDYFARHPTVPGGSMVADINLDMPVLLYDFGNIIAFGEKHSTLGDAARQATTEAGIELTPDPFPEQNIFVRTDHYRFVQQGIPAIYLATGTVSHDGKTDTLAIYHAFLHDHYHRPSDDLSLPINYEAAARFTRINARIGEIVANKPQRPAWNEGDFFGDTFSRP